LKDTIIVRDLYNLFVLGVKHELVYRTRKYEHIPDPTPERIKIIKGNGYKIKTIKADNITGYYYLQEAHLVPLEERINNISDILNKETQDGTTLLEYLQCRWETKHCIKSTAVELSDECSILLEILASYYIGGYEGDTILDQKRWEKIRQYECVSYNDEITEKLDNHVERDAQSKKPITKKKQAIAPTWSKTRSHRMNLLYSCHAPEPQDFYDCWSGKFVSFVPSQTMERKGKIDKEHSYIAEWCYVDSDRKFEFNGGEYHVASDKYDPKLGYESMDKILCYSQFGRDYFYDMDIFPIKVQKIKEINYNG
jgi:hypothetical protein